MCAGGKISTIVRGSVANTRLKFNSLMTCRLPHLFQLLLWAQLVGVSALLLAAVLCARRQTSVALTAHHLVAVVGLGESSEGRVNDSSAKTKDEVERGLLLDVVVAQGAAIFELLASEDKALLIGRDAFLVLDLGLHILDGVGRFDIQSDGLAREGLHKDLHLSCGAGVGWLWFHMLPLLLSRLYRDWSLTRMLLALLYWKLSRCWPGMRLYCWFCGKLPCDEMPD